MADRLRVGVVGVGAIGRIHAEHLATRVPSATLAGVADTNADVVQAAAERFGVRLYRDDREMFADTFVDAVAICTPRQTHSELIVESAKAGKHIFCEKPLASTLGEVDEALAAVERAGVVLQVAFQRRFDAHFADAYDAIAAGKTGKPQIVHLISRDPAPTGGRADRAPEDLVLDTTIHDIDMARYLSRSEIQSVYAIGLPGEEPERLLGAVLVLALQSGAVITIDNHLRSPTGYDQRAEVLGTSGIALVANPEPISTEGDQPFFAGRYAGAYTAELEAFARSVLDGTPPPVSGADGRASVSAALAALESLRVGQPVRVTG